VTRRIALVVLAALTLACACSSGKSDNLVLDGRPRRPDDEGVATTITRSSIVLDGARRYGVSAHLRSFSTYTLALQPVLDRVGQYVQVGLDHHDVVWLAGVGAVVATNPPEVIYTGRVVTIDRGRIVFRDGTTFRWGTGLTRPHRDQTVRVTIDPTAHVVRTAQTIT